MMQTTGNSARVRARLKKPQLYFGVMTFSGMVYVRVERYAAPDAVAAGCDLEGVVYTFLAMCPTTKWIQ